jgi:hypothetical protein
MEILALFPALDEFGIRIVLTYSQTLYRLKIAIAGPTGTIPPKAGNKNDRPLDRKAVWDEGGEGSKRRKTPET